MGLLDNFFSKKEKDSKKERNNNAGAFFCATEVPFRPHKCPNCNNYRREIERCEGFSQSTPTGEMLAMFSGKSQEDCPRFKFAIKIDIEKSKESKDVQELIESLHSKDWTIIAKASEALKIIGEPAIEPLIAALKNDKDPQFRWIVASKLGDIGGSKAVEPLINAIETDPVLDVRWHAVDSLGKIGDKAAISALNQLLNDDAIYIRDAARKALIKINDKTKKNQK